MHHARKWLPLSQRKSLRHRQGVILTGIMVIVFVFSVPGIVRFVHNTERVVWESRQCEAARNAVRTVESFLRTVQDYMALVGVLDRAYLESNPDAMYELLHKNEALLEVVRVDAGGMVFASASQGDVPVLGNLFTVPQSNWFLTAIDGHSYTGDVQISSTDQPYLILAAPAGDRGVVAVRVRMNVLWDVVAGIEFGETGQAYVVDAEGDLIAHPDPDLVRAGTSIAGRQEMEAAAAALDGMWSGQYQNFEGREVTGTSMPIDNSRWLVFTEVAYSEASAVTRQALTLAVVLGIVFGVAVIWVINRLLQQEILEPVEKLRDGAQRIRQGDLAYRIDSDREDEIGQLATAFNTMAAELQRREASLEQARDQALAASRFKSRLLANVSHDLRTPLNAILGFTDMLTLGIYGHLAPAQQRTAERILANSRQLMVLIESLLDQAQIEAGKIEIYHEPFELRRLVDEMAAIMMPFASEKGLGLTTEIDENLPAWLMGDRQRLHQLLMNLVENAVKFTESGSVRVCLHANQERWTIEVSDTGPGIAPELQETIFEAFQQVDTSSTRSRAGVGLGLSIVRDLATLMGGTVHLSSQVGAGSTFTVSLPLVVPEVEDE
ncbi:MAG: HAMP domain-containing protein [Anaerolineae bacterium]|nr:HAMP domain-containing protein [Anaerolineae bacterium]